MGPYSSQTYIHIHIIKNNNNFKVKHLTASFGSLGYIFCSSKHDDCALWKWGVALTHIVLVNGPHEWEWSHKIALHKAVQLSYSLEVHLISRQRTCLAIHFLEHWPSLHSARLQFCSHSFISSNMDQTLFTSTPSLYKEGTHFCTWVLIGWNYRFRVLLKWSFLCLVICSLA